LAIIVSLDSSEILEIPDPQFQKPDHPILLNLVQQNRSLHYTLAQNWIIRFGKPEHLVSPENQFFLISSET
jgi:hypothetical protein